MIGNSILLSVIIVIWKITRAPETFQVFLFYAERKVNFID